MKEKINFKAVILIVLVSVVLGIIYNLFSSEGIPFIRKPIIVKNGSIDAEISDPEEIRGLDLANTIGLFNQQAAIFIDARDQWEFGEGHIRGAINIPEFSFSSENELLKEIDKNKMLVIYCSGNECETSKRLAAELKKVGYMNTFIYLGGFDEWAESGLPVEKGGSNE